MPPITSNEDSDSNFSSKENSDDIPILVPVHFKTRGNNPQGQSTKEIKISNWWLCFKTCFNKLKLEVAAFLVVFSVILTQISSTSMILDKLCLINYNYSLEICSNLENNTLIKSQVEKTATSYQLGHSLIQTVPAALLSCFIGPWSDSYGRKVPMLIAIFGVSIDALGSAVCAYFLYLRVEYYYIPALFSGSFGGAITILAITYSYASDLTTEGGRTMKYACIEMAAGLAQALGVAAGGWTLKFFGYPSVFLLSASGLAISFVWVALLLPETRGQDSQEALKAKLAKLFTCRTLKEGFKATSKVRPNKGRKQILLLIVSTCFIVTATYGTTDINYLFVHHQFDWGATKYSTFMAIYSTIGVVVLVAVVPIFKHFKLGDPTLGLVGTTSLILKYICLGLAWKSSAFHIASILGSLSGCAVLAARSRISKVVSEDDLGKVFSFLAAAEALFPILMTVLIAQIFNVFLDIYAAMPYIILSASLFVPFSVFIWMAHIPGNSSDYRIITNDGII